MAGPVPWGLKAVGARPREGAGKPPTDQRVQAVMASDQILRSVLEWVGSYSEGISSGSLGHEWSSLLLRPQMIQLIINSKAPTGRRLHSDL